MTTASGEAEGAESIDLRFLSRGVSAEEAAAVTAVLVATVHDEPAAPPHAGRRAERGCAHSLRPHVEVGPHRWTHSAR